MVSFVIDAPPSSAMQRCCGVGGMLCVTICTLVLAVFVLLYWFRDRRSSLIDNATVLRRLKLEATSVWCEIFSYYLYEALSCWGVEAKDAHTYDTLLPPPLSVFVLFCTSKASKVTSLNTCCPPARSSLTSSFSDQLQAFTTGKACTINIVHTYVINILYLFVYTPAQTM